MLTSRWPNHPKTADMAALLFPYLKPGAEKAWEDTCRALEEEFSDAEAHRILNCTLDAREIVFQLSPPPSGYDGDPIVSARWALHRRKCREAIKRINQIKRWSQKNDLIDAWIRTGRSFAFESSITTTARRRGPRPNLFQQHLLLGVRHVRPAKPLRLDDVLAKLCRCFDPATTGNLSHMAIEKARTTLWRRFPITHVWLLIKAESKATKAARAFFKTHGVRVTELDMRRFADAPPFAFRI